MIKISNYAKVEIIDGKTVLNNINGPARKLCDGTEEWWINGQKLPVNTQKEFLKFLNLKGFW